MVWRKLVLFDVQAAECSVLGSWAVGGDWELSLLCPAPPGPQVHWHPALCAGCGEGGIAPASCSLHYYYTAQPGAEISAHFTTYERLLAALLLSLLLLLVHMLAREQRRSERSAIPRLVVVEQEEPVQADRWQEGGEGYLNITNREGRQARPFHFSNISKRSKAKRRETGRAVLD